jgi:hypothetical protein
MTRILRENLEHGDLQRLVHDELHIDEYKSKIGDDKDVTVVSFKVSGKEPANDIVSFVEKGYEWVLDADVSAGEMFDGDYIVFVELPRNKHTAERIMEMLEDIMNLTKQDLGEWRLRYYKDKEEHALDLDTIKRLLPSSPEEYERKYGKEDLDRLKNAAGVKVTTKAPTNEYTESLRVAAGIK